MASMARGKPLTDWKPWYAWYPVRVNHYQLIQVAAVAVAFIEAIDRKAVKDRNANSENQNSAKEVRAGSSGSRHLPAVQMLLLREGAPHVLGRLLGPQRMDRGSPGVQAQ